MSILKINMVNNKKKSRTKHIFKILVFSSLGLFILSILVATLSFCLLTKDSKLKIEKLENQTNSTTITTLDGDIVCGNMNVIDTESIPYIVKMAFVAKEDKRFFTHHGVDYIRILGALKNNLTEGEIVEGASTITQQLIKNTHFSSEKTIKRKLNEIKLAKELEKKYSKDEILEWYLNNIYFGNGVYGIKNASRFYFDKSVDKLSVCESAMLSGTISAPSVFNPLTNLDLNKKKAKIVLDKLKEQGYILDEQYLKAIDELEIKTLVKKDIVGSFYASCAEQECTEILGQDNLSENNETIIKTTIDLSLQKFLEEIIKKEDYKFSETSNPSIGIIVLDNNSGAVLGFAKNSNYDLYSLKRQPASTIKPILVYAPSLEENLISPSSFILDEPIEIGGYSPQNSTKLYYGWTTVRDNVCRSTNIPAVKLLNELGIEKGKNYAKKLGIEFSEYDNNLAIALGGFYEGVTLKDLATSYMALASNGKFKESYFVDEIVVNNISCYKHKKQENQVFSPETAYLMTDILKSVAKTGTGRKIASLGFDIATKTGTNFVNGLNLDGWNVSYTTDYTVACWFGNTEQDDEENNQQYNGSLYPTLMVKDVFSYLYDKSAPLDFDIPNGVCFVDLDYDEYLNHNLIIANESSLKTLTEVFKKNNLPPTKSLENSIIFEEDTTLIEPIFDYNKFIKLFGRW